MAKRETRYRDFATVIYPESAPENWLEILKDSHLQILISPLHDKDVNPDGEPKKAHYHVVIMYESVRTKENASEFISSFGGVGLEVVKTRRGYARYLTHLDNPEKYQYSKDDVVALGGAEYDELIKSSKDDYMIIDEIIDYIIQYKIESICALYEYARSEGHCYDWKRIIQSNTFIFDRFCSCNYKERVYGKDAPERVTKVTLV